MTPTMVIALEEIHKESKHKFHVLASNKIKNFYVAQMETANGTVNVCQGTASEVEKFLLGIQFGLISK